MSKPYAMIDLGYPRTPTDAWYHVNMPNGDVYRVPVQVIVDSRDNHYRYKAENTIDRIHRGFLGEVDVEDWAHYCMNWHEVEEYAERVPYRTREVDFQEGWDNSKNKVVGAL